MHDRAEVVVEHRVHLVLAVDGEALGAALALATELLLAEVPAARPLREVATQRRGIADLGRRGRRCRVGQGRRLLPDARIRGERRQRDQRTEAQHAVLGAYEIELAQPADVHQHGRLVETLLQAVCDVDPARLEQRSLLRARGHRTGQVSGPYPGQRLHYRTPFAAASTRAGVIGRLRTRVPVACATAFAMAAQVGTVAGSPIPLASVLLRPRK